MKTKPVYLIKISLLSTFFLLATLQVFSQTIEGMTYSASNNSYTFLPQCDSSGDGVADGDCPGNYDEKYHALWEFGDGEYSFAWEYLKVYNVADTEFTPRLLISNIKDEDGEDEAEPDGVSLNIITGGPVVVGSILDFTRPLVPKPQLKVNAFPKAGHKFYLMIRFADHRTTGVSANHTLSYPSSVSPATTSGADVIYFNEHGGPSVDLDPFAANSYAISGTVNPNEYFDVVFQFVADENLTVEDSVEFTLTMYSGSVVDNQRKVKSMLKLKVPVVTAWDPNHKSSSPPIISPGQEIWYTIDFRNDSNTTANSVIVVDTLSDLLDWTTFGHVSAWDDLNPLVPIVDMHTGEVKFNIPVCALTPFREDPAYSDGWVKFSIRANTDLTCTDTIKNKAWVTFEENPPMVTDVTTNYLNCPEDNCCPTELKLLKTIIGILIAMFVMLIIIFLTLYRCCKKKDSLS